LHKKENNTIGGEVSSKKETAINQQTSDKKATGGLKKTTEHY
jgi:hypothetical protein